ncbi:hypothetical protein [Flexivirga caeni]|uniref:Uncharacterized protein n=1 Tax=Flexivirga caeni TaxID=2294115 RepID=A0A3M9M815_9MICO|nr:hypothetical protein [Flexivirga caeni]RNI21355.1 hypothetical protein EFY87_11805 [Flexivirga caeni]
MTTPHPQDPGTRRKWRRRILIVVACWLIAWGLTAWLNMHPDSLGLLAALAALAAVYWLASDRFSGWDATSWEGSPAGRRLRTNADSRISYLTRLIADGRQQSRDEPNASANSLQGILRDAALDRLRERAAASGAMELPDDEQLLAEADPRLTAYLHAQPAPPTTTATITDIVNRIEAL